MTALPRLPAMWRVLREANLEAIRREAERPFEVFILAEALPDAVALCALLTGEPDRACHPWLHSVAAAEGGGLPAGAPDAAVLVSRAADLGPILDLTRDALREAGVPVVTVAVGLHGATDGVVRPGEAARAAVSALNAAGLPAIARALLSAVRPGVRLSLARQLPPLRPTLFTDLIEETAKANALYSFTAGMAEAVPVVGAPLNLADIVVLTKNQLVMSYKIALAAGKKGTPRVLLGEVFGVIGGGLLFRQGARQLVGLIPVVGIAPKVAVAYAGTWAIGRAVAAWAADGRRLSPAAVRGFYREARGRGKEIAVAIVAQARRTRRPGWLRRGRKRGAAPVGSEG